MAVATETRATTERLSQIGLLAPLARTKGGFRRFAAQIRSEAKGGD